MPARVGAADGTRLFAYVAAFAVLNLYATHMFHAVRIYGWGNAILLLFEINAIIWFALFAILKIANEPAMQDARDVPNIWLVASAFLLAVLPWHALSLASLFILGLAGFVATPPRSRTRRIAVIILSIGLSTVIGRFLLAAFGAPIVAADAWFVAAMAGVEARDNVVDFVGGGRTFIVGTPCSSVHNMSLGFIMWASVTQCFNLRIDRRSIGWCLTAVAALFLVNAVRLMAIAWFPDHFDTLHNGMAGELFGWISLMVAGLVIAVGALDGAKRRAA